MTEPTPLAAHEPRGRDREIVWLLRALLIVSIVGVALLAWDAID